MPPLPTSDQPYLGPNPERGTVAASTPKTAAPPDPSQTRVIELLSTARKQFQLSSQAEAKLREKMRDDQRFRDADQWPANIKADRDSDQRPCLTINRLPIFIRQVTNQQRQSRPAIQINPVDSSSDPDTAEVIQGIVRHIETQSNADVAYDTACDHQVTIGRGFIRIVIDWSDVNPWEQEIRIKRVRNPFTIYFDPACQEVDYRDARFAFVVEDVPRDEFIRLYGSDAATNQMLFQSIGDRSGDWYPEGKVRIAEYFYVEIEEERVSLLSNGEQMSSATLANPDVKEFLADTGVTILRTRTIKKQTVKWAKITGSAVLEEGEWPGRWIPIVPVLGDEIDMNGEVDLKGMVRDAKDPQRMYNYWVSAETEMIALAPRAPFIGYEGQFAGHEEQWKLANRRNYPYLEAKPVSLNGQLAPLPQRNVAEPPIMALVAATRQSDNDLKAVTGFYDASLGEQGPESSGKAILARQKQGDISNINWLDNLGRAIRSVGRQIVDLIPKVYDTPRVMRIIGIDQQSKTVLVGPQAALPSSPEEATDRKLPEGLAGIYALDVGQYDVTTTVGPSYQSRRQEAVASMTAFIGAFPAAAPLLGDVLAESMDWPGAKIVAERLKKMLPPGIQDKKPGEPEVPPEVQQQMQQMAEMLKKSAAAIDEMKQIIETKQIEAQAKERSDTRQIEARERLAMIEAQKDMAIAALGSKTDAAIEMAKQQRTEFATKLAQDHDVGLQALNHAHERVMSASALADAARSREADAMMAPMDSGRRRRKPAK